MFGIDRLPKIEGSLNVRDTARVIGGSCETREPLLQ